MQAAGFVVVDAYQCRYLLVDSSAYERCWCQVSGTCSALSTASKLLEVSSLCAQFFLPPVAMLVLLLVLLLLLMRLLLLLVLLPSLNVSTSTSLAN